MKPAIITDEVSSDLETALELIHTWGIEAVELRYLGDQRFPQVSDYWHDRLPRLLDEFKLSVAAISPGLFQFPYPGSPASIEMFRALDIPRFERERQAREVLDRHLNVVLPAAIKAAQRLGAPTIVCFGFTAGDPPEPVAEVLREAALMVGAAGLTLALEPRDSSANTASLIRQANVSALGLNWDPANMFNAGEDVPFPDGYEHVRGLVRHVHFKDVRTDLASGDRFWTLHGVIDWAGIIGTLKHDGYPGYVSVETHVRPKIDGTMRTLDRLRRLMAQA